MKKCIILLLVLPLETPLFSATHNTQLDALPNEIVTCCICLEDNLKNTMIHLACNHFFDADCIYTWLIERNTCPLCQANLDELEAKNNTLLSQAEKGNSHAIKQLLAAGAKIEATNGSGCTPLILAARFGRLVTVKILLAAGANMHAKNALGRTALMQAAKHKHPYVVRALVNAVRDELVKHKLVNTTDTTGTTPLMLAVESGSFSSVKTLVDAQADINAVGIHGNNALAIAREMYHYKIADYLKSF